MGPTWSNRMVHRRGTQPLPVLEHSCHENQCETNRRHRQILSATRPNADTVILRHSHQSRHPIDRRAPKPTPGWPVCSPGGYQHPQCTGTLVRHFLIENYTPEQQPTNHATSKGGAQAPDTSEGAAAAASTSEGAHQYPNTTPVPNSQQSSCPRRTGDDPQ
jgi:hypothetical protein